MFTRLTPFAVSQNIYDIDVNFFVKNKIKYIFCDLDNTLDAYYSEIASDKAIDFKNKVQKKGIKLIVISNNTKKRVSKYAKSLNCDYLYSTRKPLIFKLKSFIKKNQIDKNMDEVTYVKLRVNKCYLQYLKDLYYDFYGEENSIYVKELINHIQFFTQEDTSSIYKFYNLKEDTKINILSKI